MLYLFLPPPLGSCTGAVDRACRGDVKEERVRTHEW